MPPRKRKTGARTNPDTPKSKRTKTATAKPASTQANLPKATMTGQATNPFSPYPPSKVYCLIEPGPILLVSTGPTSPSKSKSKSKSKSSGPGPGANDINLMTMGFHMMLQHSSPPLIAACIGPWDATYARLKVTRECVLAIPSAEMAQTVVDIGNCSMDDLGGAQANDGEEETAVPGDKFEKFGLDALPAAKVKAPLVGGEHVMANVECVVEDDKMVAKYHLWVLRVVKAWVNEAKKPGEGGRMFHHRGDGTFSVDGEEVLDLRERMVKWRMLQD